MASIPTINKIGENIINTIKDAKTSVKRLKKLLYIVINSNVDKPFEMLRRI